MRNDLNSLSAEIHEDNVKAGWWSDIKTGLRRDRNVGEMLMLVVSEIAEAAEGDEQNLNDDKLPHLSMLAVELADTNIRIFDLAGFHNVDLDELISRIGDIDGITEEDIEIGMPAMLLRLVRHISGAMEGNRRGKQDKAFPEYKEFDVRLAMAVRDAYAIAYALNYDLDDVIRQKREFNAKREDHKVENRLAAGGKSY